MLQVTLGFPCPDQFELFTYQSIKPFQKMYIENMLSSAKSWKSHLWHCTALPPELVCGAHAGLSSHLALHILTLPLM